MIQASDGFFYGTTELGGYGGEIFRMDAAGNFTVIHRFDAYASDGWKPVSGLIEGRDGFLYGTAPIGGQPVTASSRYGVVYRMDKAGAVTVLHTFTGSDGASRRLRSCRARTAGCTAPPSSAERSGSACCSAIDPAAPAPPQPSPDAGALTLRPSSVVGGQASTGTVTLGGPAPSGGAIVTLSSSNDSVASIPPTVTVTAGATSASFGVSTERVKRTKTVTVKASYNGSSVSATLTVTR